MNNEMKKRRKESRQMTDQHRNLNLMTCSKYNELEFVDVRETSWNVGEQLIVGRKDEKNKLMDFLLEGMTPNIITILPIYGIGGIGKTTFAKLIYDDTKFKYYSRVWVHVSPRFDLNKIGNSIISQRSKLM
jgi:translation initiation factor RLI1